MTATDCTPEQMTVRTSTLRAIMDERAHRQTTWIDNDAAYRAIGKLFGNHIPDTYKVEVNVCGTAACAAGHAVLTQIDAQVVTKQDNGLTRLEYRYRGKLRDADDTLTAMGRNLGVDTSDNPWATVGAELLGLGDLESRALFEGGNTHEHMVYLMLLLCDQQDILAPDYASMDYDTFTQTQLYEDHGDYTCALVDVPTGWEMPVQHRALDDFDPEDQFLVPQATLITS